MVDGRLLQAIEFVEVTIDWGIRNEMVNVVVFCGNLLFIRDKR